MTLNAAAGFEKEMDMDASFPREVPKLKAENMCRDYYDGPNGTHCLLGWLKQQFYGRDCWRAAEMAIINAAGMGIVTFNDDHTYEESASVWNVAMSAIGYIDAGDRFVRPEAA